MKIHITSSHSTSATHLFWKSKSDYCERRFLEDEVLNKNQIKLKKNKIKKIYNKVNVVY